MTTVADILPEGYVLLQPNVRYRERRTSFAFWYRFLQQARNVLAPIDARRAHQDRPIPNEVLDGEPVQHTIVQHEGAWPYMEDYLHEARRAYFMQALKAVGAHEEGSYKGKYRLKAAADLMGVSASQVTKMMNKYDIKHPCDRE